MERLILVVEVGLRLLHASVFDRRGREDLPQ